MNRENVSRNGVDVALKLQTISSDTTTNGEIIDLQDFGSCMLAFITGTVTDGDYTLLLHEGDESNLSDASAVADADLYALDASGNVVASGQELAGSTTDNTDDDQVSRLGYLGTKRYIRLSIVSTNTSSGAVLGAVAVKSDPRSMPVAENQDD